MMGQRPTLKDELFVYVGREGIDLLREFLRDEIHEEMPPKLLRALQTVQDHIS